MNAISPTSSCKSEITFWHQVRYAEDPGDNALACVYSAILGL